MNKLVKFAGGADKPHIICGDFNTPPTFPAYHMLTNSRLTPETKSILTTMTENLNEVIIHPNKPGIKHLSERTPSSTFSPKCFCLFDIFLLNICFVHFRQKEKLIGKDITELLPEAFCLQTDFKSAYKTVLVSISFH